LNLLLLLLSLVLQTVSRTASIEGLIVREGTSPALRLANARLELEGSAGGALVTRSDDMGRFVFSGVPAGRYRLRVKKDGYIRQEYPRAAMDEPGLPITLSAGQALKDMVFQLEPATTILGVVHDEGYAPVAGIEVRALKRVYTPRGDRALTLLASALTDDLGRYRLYWVDPGEYFIAAMFPSAVDGSAGPARITWAPTYYPGAVDLDGARSIRVESGRDVGGVDIKLTRQPLLTVTGITYSPARGPVPASVTLAAPEEGAGVARHAGMSSPQGTYSVPGVAPGTYIIAATAGGETAAQRIRVVRDPLRNRIDLQLGPGVPVPGRVVNAAGSPMALENLRIRLSELDVSLPEPMPQFVDSNHRFLFSAVQPGDYTLSVEGLPGDLYMKSAAAGTVDVLAKPLSVNYRRLPVDLEIQIGLDGGRVDGLVFDRNDRLFVGAQVVLAPVAGSRSRLDRYRTGVSDENGGFTLRGVAPGEYRLFAWSSVTPYAYLNFEYMRPYESLGAPIQIQPGGNSPISLRVIELPR
jgi:hypothetical protein